MIKEKVFKIIKTITKNPEILKLVQEVQNLLQEFKTSAVDIINLENKNVNFSNLINQTAGIYYLVNSETKKIYVGQTQNLAFRLEQHKDRIFNGKHQINELNDELKDDLKKKDFESIHSKIFAGVIFSFFFPFDIGLENKQTLENLLLKIEQLVCISFENENCVLYNRPKSVLQEVEKPTKKFNLETIDTETFNDYINTIRIYQIASITEKVTKTLPGMNSTYFAAARSSRAIVHKPTGNFFVNAKVAQLILKSGTVDTIQRWAKNKINGLRYAQDEEISLGKYLKKYD